MSKWRKAAKIDSAQTEIVKTLRTIPGITVEPGHDDILLGHKGRTFWFEIKSASAVSKKTGNVLESAKKDSQKKLEAGWAGHYQIVSSIEEILRVVGI